eukprot:783662-Prymnesium_polylepis.1
MGVSSMPTFLLFRAGEKVGSMRGADEQRHLLEWLARRRCVRWSPSTPRSPRRREADRETCGGVLRGHWRGMCGARRNVCGRAGPSTSSFGGRPATRPNLSEATRAHNATG